MSIDTIIDSLTKQFNARYAKKFADLNKNVYPTAKNDKGSFEVPVPVLGPGGGTLITGNPEAFTLKPAAKVSVQFKVMQPQRLIYRISIPFNECEIASNKPEYFNYLFDAVINKALGNYEKTVGGPDVVRFGESYCNYTTPDNKIFKITEDNDLEIRLYGCWASNQEDYS